MVLGSGLAVVATVAVDWLGAEANGGRIGGDARLLLQTEGVTGRAGVMDGDGEVAEETEAAELTAAEELGLAGTD